jgi:uncharacterized damage-inducible protein DinB
MQKLPNAKGQLNYAMNMAMKTLDKTILAIPDDKLDYKPVKDALSASEIATHVYMVALVYTAGTLQGKFDEEDYAIIPFDPKTITSAQDIIDFGAKVKQYMQDSLEKMTEENMNNQIVYNCWGGFKIGGFESLSTILEEVIHHRGQLSLYLRMLGIKPPFIYDFS